MKQKSLYKQWDEICRIYHEVEVGERVIQKEKDGKWYAVRVNLKSKEMRDK